MRLIDNEYRVLREENNRLKHNHRSMEERVAENKEKIKLNNQLSYQEAGSKSTKKCVVLKTSTRQTVFLPVPGLVDAETLKPGDLVGVN